MAENIRKVKGRKYKKIPGKPVKKFPIKLIKRDQEKINENAAEPPNKLALELPSEKAKKPASKIALELPIKNIPEPPTEKSLKPPNKNALELPCEVGSEPLSVKALDSQKNNDLEPPRKNILGLSSDTASEPPKVRNLEPPSKNALELPFDLKLEAQSDISLPPPPPLPHIPKALIKALKREDEKYKDINFDEPPSIWSKEDKSKMRDIIRTMSIQYKKQSNKSDIYKIDQRARNFGPIEMGMAREIVGLLQKDTNLLNRMELKDLAFSTFLKNTYDWVKVAEMFENKHTPAECKEYWYMDLYPRLKNMGFNADSNKKLLELAVANKYRNWDQIADKLIGHTEYQCYVHFRRNLYKNLEMLNEITKRGKKRA